MKRFLTSLAVLGTFAFASAANATVVTFFDDYTNGPNLFDSTVTGTGGSVNVDNWTGIGASSTITRADYTVVKNNGAIMSPFIYSNGGVSTSGQVISINPSSTDVAASRATSAMKFTFSSAVNSIGFEVGDWATCCWPSRLYISFDGGAPILVGESTVYGDQFLTSGTANVFVGAIDDTGSFTTVEFWGDGLGEALYAGGTIRYAAVAEGSLPPAVPEPGVVAIFGAGLAGLGFARRRRAVRH